MKKLALLTLLLSSLTSSAVAQPQTSALTFETQGLDLETGLVLELGDPDVDASAVDLHIAANADRTTQAVVFQAAGAELARMGGTHFEYVSPSDIGSLIFTLEPVDQPCGAGDTVMIRTVGGSVYKIGNFLEDEASGAVLFDYELLEGPQAALPPRMETEAPARMAARPAGKVSLLGAEARQAIAQFVERDRYGIRRTGAAWLASGTLEASNPAQAYTTRFTPGGVVVVPKGRETGLGLALTGWGYEMALASVTPVAPQGEGQRVEYVHGPLVEWYVNRSTGLEQGFTLNAAPTGASDRAPLRIEMALSGPLTAEARGGSIFFSDQDGSVRLRYGGLKAWDATGRDLVAGMNLAGNRLALEVDLSEAVYPVFIDPTIVTEDAKLLASDGAADDQLGYAVGASGDTVVVSAAFDDDAGSSSGSAYVFEKPIGGWAGTLTEAAKLVASDAAAVDQFGYSAGFSGDVVVVGARLDDDSGSSSGSVYVFEKPVGGWVGTVNEVAKLLASDGASGDALGEAVAIDGDTVVAGARGNGDNGAASGSAYVFVKPAGGWVGTVNDVAKLLASDGVAADSLGWSVAVSGDTVVVGARFDDDAGANTGSAYVYEKPAGGWAGTLNENAKVLGSDAAAGDQFGFSATASGDTVVVGSIRDDDNGTSSGSAYVFTKPAGGWAGNPLTESAKLLASDGSTGDNVGQSLAMAGDTIVAGAARDSDNGSVSGSVYIFEKPAGGWAGSPLDETTKLLASDGAVSDKLGWAVALSGSTLIATANLDDDNGLDSGSAYIFDIATCTDSDGDGYGSPGDASCPGGAAEDCNDGNVAINPGAVEACDGIDNNCNLTIDEGFDLDNDGFTSCGGDCNDGDVAINPGATEVCDAIDNDCDAAIDEGTPDFDGDLVCDALDNCEFKSNPGQENCDGDATGNVCDFDDSDGDGLSDALEINFAGGVCPGGCPDPLDSDSDDDGLLDSLEADSDPDRNCDLCLADTDEDGVGDASDPLCNDAFLSGDLPMDLADFGDFTLQLPNLLFQVPGANTPHKREQARAHLAAMFAQASKHLEKNHGVKAKKELKKARGRVDGVGAQQVMVEGTPEKEMVRETIDDFCELIEPGTGPC